MCVAIRPAPTRRYDDSFLLLAGGPYADLQHKPAPVPAVLFQLLISQWPAHSLLPLLALLFLLLRFFLLPIELAILTLMQLAAGTALSLAQDGKSVLPLSHVQRQPQPPIVLPQLLKQSLL